jgi:hypothetical protein
MPQGGKSVTLNPALFYQCRLSSDKDTVMEVAEVMEVTAMTT